jgi:hypothetical protein
MSEDEKLIVKWLESPEGEYWSYHNHVLIYRPLVSVITDGVSSDLIADNNSLWRG